MPLLKDDFGVQIYVFDPALLIGTGFRTVGCTSTPTTGSRATSKCNSAPWHHRRLILVSWYMFLTMLSWLEQVSELSDVHQHQQQCQQHGPRPLQGVTQLPGIIEGWSLCPHIYFWPSRVDSNRFQNCQKYTNTINNVNNRVHGYFKV